MFYYYLEKNTGSKKLNDDDMVLSMFMRQIKNKNGG